jgi:hypothetical protein
VFADYAPRRVVLRLLSRSQAPLTGFAVAVTKNPLGIAVDGTPVFPVRIEFGKVAEVVVPLTVEAAARARKGREPQIAIRTSRGDVYAADRVHVEAVTVAEREAFSNNH